MIDQETIINSKLREKVYNDFLNKLDKKYSYHNLDHTKRVIKSAIKIGADQGLSEGQWKVLLTACLLHDFGFIKSHIDHEETGADIAESVLPEHGYNQDEIKLVKSLILVTKAISIPNNKLEAIIRDSDLEYLGSNNFEIISEKLKEEWIACNVVSSEEEFYKLQLDFLINHQFHTEYMRKKGKKLKDNNIKYAHDMVKKSHH
ncbi:MAG: hypothetical protein CL870_00285 [Cytophagia bacterium]|jgi:HD superfamily phosphodiesterase|nr:hypothetical protein [Cytophagia bacterium]